MLKWPLMTRSSAVLDNNKNNHNSKVTDFSTYMVINTKQESISNLKKKKRSVLSPYDMLFEQLFLMSLLLIKKKYCPYIGYGLD